MAKGRTVSIVLDDVEKRDLTALTRKHGPPQALAERGAHKAGCDVNASSCRCSRDTLASRLISRSRNVASTQWVQCPGCLVRTLRPETNIGATGQGR